MEKRLFVVTALGMALLVGPMPAAAQQSPAGPMTQAPAEQPRGDQGPAGMMRRGGMMGQGMMGGMMDQGMMGRGMTGRMGQGAPMPPMMMRLMFALMDADGDGSVSLQEFQAAHERIFKAMDSNKDGKLTSEEMQAFMRGTARAPAP